MLEVGFTAGEVIIQRLELLSTTLRQVKEYLGAKFVFFFKQKLFWTQYTLYLSKIELGVEELPLTQMPVGVSEFSFQ